MLWCSASIWTPVSYTHLLIPELIGRLPVITVLDDLDEDALVRVLKEPRNSLVKQYKELLSMDSVEPVSYTHL